MFTHDFYFTKTRKSREDVVDFITRTDKKILYTVGYKWKNPTTRDVPVTKEYAIELFDKNKLITIKEKESVVDINVYTASDMW